MAIDPQMQKVVDYMVTTENSVAEKSRQNGDRPWMNFDKVAKAGKFEFEQVHKIFDRSASNDEYGRLRSQKQSESKDLQTAKLSSDFLAGCERDYRMRTRSRVRMLVHCAVTSAASFGNNEGGLRRNTVDWLGRVLADTRKVT